ncbi:MAG TPA: hypothetical protein VFE90_24130 [Myxococcales bacterium]|nr:hypothetical protein [Myxococcales bacterium]
MSSPGTTGNPAGPAVQSFTAAPGVVSPGAQAQLTAVFQGGQATIDNGVGAVQSGVPVMVAPAATTTYTLTVGVGSAAVSSAATVVVSQPGAACIGGPLLQSLGRTRILTGASMADGTASAAGWDARYVYLAGGLFDGSAPCQSCATSCTAAQVSCANTVGCGWYGCWQWDQLPPGQYIRDFVSGAKGRGEVPWLTYYELLQTSKANEGSAEVAALNDAAVLTRYLADFRFLLQQIGTNTAFVHVEPDFWAFAEQVNGNPHAIAAKVREAAPADCGAEEESLAGFGHCLIAMARKYAPNARIGFHASPFATGIDVAQNRNASLDVAAEARKLAAFLAAAGATAADFVVTDASDRDAGYYASIGQQRGWDATNQTLPNFHQDLSWVKALAEAMQLPVIFWQLPVGNTTMNNTADHWQDNRVEYFYAHTAELAAAHVAGMLFGAGAGGQTTPETDGGLLLSREKAYEAAGGQQLCP